jgi:predicted phosphodiesterase
MHILDLGQQDETLLLFGGNYSNLQATLALIEKAQQLGIPANRCINTGDIVAYCANPNETTEALMEWGNVNMKGNCEVSFSQNQDDCGCGFSEGTQCDLLSKAWFDFANQRLKQEHRTWFNELPDGIVLNHHSKKVQFVHGSVTQINQFLYDSSDSILFDEQFANSDADIVVAGHSGVPFTKTVGNRIWHNTGALGMPANDGTQRVWYSILNEGVLSHHALNYDYQLAQQEMLTAGLTQGYHDCLENGLWPSTDVLPQKETADSGKPLSL